MKNVGCLVVPIVALSAATQDLEVSFLAKEQQPIEPTHGIELRGMARAAQNEAAIRLLHQWPADESGYDERVWSRLKEAIEVDRLSFRKRYSD